LAIVSVHVPKTGGTSLTKQIEQGAFGSWLLDYDDRPRAPGLPARARRGISRVAVRLRAGTLRRYGIIHGHFPADKYRPVADAFMIFLRDPVERLVSHYCYWRDVASKNPATVRNNPLVGEVAAGRMDLVALAWWQRDYYRTFVGGLEIADFDVVGLTEEYDAGIALINRRFNVALQPGRERARETGYADRIDPVVLQYNEENYHYYRQARDRFEMLKKELL
jgi:hypothetical protein